MDIRNSCLVNKTIYSKVNISTNATKYITVSLVGFGNCPHEYTRDIISDHLIKYDIQHIVSLEQGSNIRYTKRVYAISIVHTVHIT